MGRQVTFKFKGNTIEVFYDGKLRAVILPGDQDEPIMRIGSTHLRKVEKTIGGVLDIYTFDFFTD